ncbi:uncharacterized [Tachysurus ichikawai]
MAPLFVAFLVSIKEKGRSCLPRRWFNGPGQNNGATFNFTEGLIIWDCSQDLGPETFPLDPLNGSEGTWG